MDAFYFFLILISLVGLVVVVSLVAGFSILYRKEKNPEATQIEGSTLLEATWTIIPLALFMVASSGARCFTSASTTRPPTR